MGKFLQYIFIGLICLCITACASDDDADTYSSDREKVCVTISLGVQKSNNLTRTWQDTNAKTDRSEMMYNWTIYIVGSDEKIVDILSNDNVAEANAEVEVVKQKSDNYTLDAGTYKFYTFANYKPSGLGNKGEAFSLTDTYDGLTQSELLQLGSDKDHGIPMTNVQTITVSSSTTSIDLIAVRTVAKVTLRLYNATNNDINIKNVLISDYTKENTGAFTLLPKYSSASSANSMDAGGVDLSFSGVNTTTSNKSNFSYSSSGVVASKNTAYSSDGSYTDLTFYMNESQVATDSPYGYFLLTLTTDTETKRYGLLTDEGWDKIIRNNHYIIPISLDGYKMDLVPFDYPAIGVLSASVKEEDGIFTCTFHSSGHFHLVPKVTDSAGNAVTISSATWTHGDNTSLYFTSTEITDASENGGVPVWDATNKYIFGKFNSTTGIDKDGQLNVTLAGGVTMTYHVWIYRK